MAANPATDFDLGPLSWVKTEIDHSLNQARENLDKLAAKPGERGPVKYILTHLHQATGALAMVGLGAATRFNEELEKLVAYLETEDAAHLAETGAVAKRGIAALSSYLDALLAGEPDRPMRLLAPYLELNRARGQNDANEGDLFYPDLSTPLPALAPAAAVQKARLAVAACIDSMAHTAACIWRSASATSAPLSMRSSPCWYCARCSASALESTASSSAEAGASAGSGVERSG
ncbi:MAG TPA: hypothetical protein VF038_16590 [Usitatibacter sp.]